MLLCAFTQHHHQRRVSLSPARVARVTSFLWRWKKKTWSETWKCGVPGASRCMDSAVACHFGDNWSALRDHCLSATAGLESCQECCWVRENVVTHTPATYSMSNHSHFLHFTPQDDHPFWRVSSIYDKRREHQSTCPYPNSASCEKILNQVSSTR